AMQPFKMLVGDMVNEKQKGLAYSIQSFLCNAGSVVGYIAPIVLALFLSNTAPAGEVPPTVTWAFYIGAAILLLCVIYSFAKIREMPPAEYAAFHGIKPTTDKKEKNENMLRLLVKAPKVFWTVGLVQFFCWAAFLYMWTYSTDAIASHAFGAPSYQRVTGITVNGQAYNDKYIFNGTQPVLTDGSLTMAGVDVDGQLLHPSVVCVNGDTIIVGGQPVVSEGVAKVASHRGFFAAAGDDIVIDGNSKKVASSAATVSALDLVEPGTVLTLAHIASKNNANGEYILEQTSDIPAFDKHEEVGVNYVTVLNAASKQYQDAGDWNGVLLAIQAIAAVLWAAVLATFRSRKPAYSMSLLIGAAGFISVWFIHSPVLLGVSYALMGCAWAAMLAMPFTILTNALSGNHIGTYLGLFNCTICVPQIIAALCGGLLLGLFPAGSNGAPQTVMMLCISGVLLLLGAITVWNIKETFGSQHQE
ncbi:MAG: MFS transporter, partial [Muribaculaceae bacterium]|nr:MFS transporter [Muribaculaceae bacterium]